VRDRVRSQAGQQAVLFRPVQNPQQLRTQSVQEHRRQRDAAESVRATRQQVRHDLEHEAVLHDEVQRSIMQGAQGTGCCRTIGPTVRQVAALAGSLV